MMTKKKNSENEKFLNYLLELFIHIYTTKLFFLQQKFFILGKDIIIIMYLHNTHIHTHIVNEIIPVYCTWLVTINFIHNFHFVSFLPSSLPLGSFFSRCYFVVVVVLCLFSHHFFFYLAPCVCTFRNSTTLNQNIQNTFHW